MDQVTVRLVTVIVPDHLVYNPTVPKKKQKAVEEELPTEYQTVQEEYKALCDRIILLNGKLSSVNRGSSQHKDLVGQKNELEERLMEIRPAYRAWKWKNAMSQDIYREDGSINCGAAIKVLLERVAKLEVQLAELIDER